jgi:hypothetical protein
MLHTFQPDEAVCKPGHLGRFAVDDQYLKAGIVVQVCVTGGNHQFVIRVLQLGQFFGNPRGVMVVDEGNSAHYSRVRGCGLFGHQLIADQIAKSLGAIRVPSLADQTVKPLEKLRIQRNTDPAQNAHTHSR